MKNILVLSFISGAVLLSSSVQAQYKYTPKTPSPTTNKKTYQFTPVNSQKEATTPIKRAVTMHKTATIPDSKLVEHKSSSSNQNSDNPNSEISGNTELMHVSLVITNGNSGKPADVGYGASLHNKNGELIGAFGQDTPMGLSIPYASGDSETIGFWGNGSSSGQHYFSEFYSPSAPQNSPAGNLTFSIKPQNRAAFNWNITKLSLILLFYGDNQYITRTIDWNNLPPELSGSTTFSLKFNQLFKPLPISISHQGSSDITIIPNPATNNLSTSDNNNRSSGTPTSRPAGMGSPYSTTNNKNSSSTQNSRTTLAITGNPELKKATLTITTGNSGKPKGVALVFILKGAGGGELSILGIINDPISGPYTDSIYAPGSTKTINLFPEGNPTATLHYSDLFATPTANPNLTLETMGKFYWTFYNWKITKITLLLHFQGGITKAVTWDNPPTLFSWETNLIFPYNDQFQEMPVTIHNFLDPYGDPGTPTPNNPLLLNVKVHLELGASTPLSNFHVSVYDKYNKTIAGSTQQDAATYAPLHFEANNSYNPGVVVQLLGRRLMNFQQTPGSSLGGGTVTIFPGWSESNDSNYTHINKLVLTIIFNNGMTKTVTKNNFNITGSTSHYYIKFDQNFQIIEAHNQN